MIRFYVFIHLLLVRACVPGKNTRDKMPRVFDSEDFKVYVGGLRYGVTERDIERMFDRYGTVSRFLLVDQLATGAGWYRVLFRQIFLLRLLAFHRLLASDQ